MTVDTNNYYGKISISNSAIAAIAGFATLECYGVVDLVSKNLKDNIKDFIKKQHYTKGIKVANVDNRIILDVYCILKYGVSLSAVAESLKKSVKYSVENFTGMIVEKVNVHVVGIQV